MVRRLIVEIACGRCGAEIVTSGPPSNPTPPVTIGQTTLHIDLCTTCREVWFDPFVAEAKKFGQTEREIEDALNVVIDGVDLRICPVCLGTFVRMDRTRRHLKDHHPGFWETEAARPWWPTGRKREPCPYCEKPQFGGQGMAAHKRHAHPVEFAKEQATKKETGFPTDE